MSIVAYGYGLKPVLINVVNAFDLEVQAMPDIEVSAPVDVEVDTAAVDIEVNQPVNVEVPN